jgi:hypothetical protein
MKWQKQFSLRDLIWLIMLCAVGVGWLADHDRQAKALDESEAEVARLITADILRLSSEHGHANLQAIRNQPATENDAAERNGRQD